MDLALKCCSSDLSSGLPIMALFVALRWVRFLRSGDALRPLPPISVRILRPHSTRKCSTHLPAIPHAAPIPPFPWKLSWVPSSSSPGRFLYSFFFFAISLYLPRSPQGRPSPRILLPPLIASLKSKCNITPGSFGITS